MALIVLRFVFLMVAVGLGFQLSNSDSLGTTPAALPYLAFGGVVLVAVGVVAAGVIVFMVRRRRSDVDAE